MTNKFLYFFILIFLGLADINSAKASVADQLAGNLSAEPINKALHFFLIRDCLKKEGYFSPEQSVQNLKKECSFATEKFITALDISPLDPRIIFWNELHQLSLNDKNAQLFEDFSYQLNSMNQQSESYDIWSLFTDNLKDTSTALKAFAVVYQNTRQGFGALDTKYYKSKSQRQFYNSTNAALFEILKDNPNQKIMVDGFRVQNIKFYHFFVPAYLTQELINQGVSKKMAIYLAYAFNRAYEILDDPNFMVEDLKARERPMTAETATDTVMAFAGALYGAQYKLDVNKLDLLTKKFMQNPFSAEHELLMYLKALTMNQP